MELTSRLEQVWIECVKSRKELKKNSSPISVTSLVGELFLRLFKLLEKT